MTLFDIPKLKTAFFKEETFVDGEKISCEDDIEILEINDNRITDEKRIKAKIVDRFEREYDVYLTIINREYYATLIGERGCNCEMYIEKKENCKHMSGLILYLNNYKFEDLRLNFFNNEESNTEIKKVIDEFKYELYKKFNTDSMFHVSAFLEIDSDGIKMFFKINKKYGPSYTIKDINYFLELLETNGSHAYAKKNEFIHDINNFDKKSHFNMELMRNNFKNICKNNSKFLILSPNVFFKMFDFSNGATINCSIEGEVSNNLEIRRYDCPFFIEISKIGEMIKIRLKPNYLNIFRCGDGFIWIHKNELCYYFPEDKNMRLLMASLYKKNVQLTKEDYIKYMIFVNSSLEGKVEVIDNIDIEEMDSSLDEINLKVEYIDKIIIISFPDFDIQKEFNLEGNVDYIRLIKILNYLSKFASYENKKFKIINPKEMFDFLDKGIFTIENLANNIKYDKTFSQLKIEQDIQTNVNVGLKEEKMYMEIKLNNFTTKEIQSILHNYTSGENYVLINDRLLNLHSESFKSLIEMTELLEKDMSKYGENGFEFDKHKALLIDIISEKYSDINFEMKSELLKEIEKIKAFKIEDFKPESLVQTELREYQKDGINYMLSLEKIDFGCVLADEMGLGKTVQSIAVIATKIKEGKKTLIVCPTSLIYNWEKEIIKFIGKQRTLLILGDVKQRAKIIEKIEDNDIIITSYDLLKKDINKYEKYVFDLFIIDEAQYIKNIQTQNYQTVTQIKAKQKIALTGTPIENSIKELWSIINFVIPGYLGNNKHFIKFFETPIIQSRNSKRLNLLKQITNPFILRRLKNDVLEELPKKIEKFMYNEMLPEQEELYNAYILKYQKQILEKENISKIELLSMIMRLRQVANDPRVIKNETIKGNKINQVMEIVENCRDNNQKVLVFSQFTKMLDLIENRLRHEEIKYYILTGKNTKEQRQSFVEKFNKDDSTVFLISLKAGGTGLNLTAASNVVLVDPWWNMSVQNQATDRAHRIGQTSNVLVHKLISKDTIENKIVEIQNEKNKLAKTILDNSEDKIEAIDIDLLKKIISR